MSLKINDLAELNLRELTEEECKSLQGGWYWAYDDYNLDPGLYNPQPAHKPNPTDEPIINNVPCTNHPFGGSSLPWCAVVL